MSRVNNQLYLFLFALTGMVIMGVCMIMGHNGPIQATFLTLNAAGLGGGLVKSFVGGKANGKEEKDEES